MEEFVKSLKKGKLTTSFCVSCRTLIWPPSNICPRCLSNKIRWIEIDTNGKLLEFSESLIANKPTVFGLVELNDNVRLLGRITCKDNSALRRGMDVKMIRCGIEGNDAYYEFQPI
ncbi:MAG: zinc ribbon domain-containing protein [Nitrososphaerales archaeon]